MKQPLKKILIVDDDPRNIFALKAVLNAQQFEVHTVTGAEEALEFLQAATDAADYIVLMDMMMPGMDGYEAISQIRNHAQLKQQPVIAVTAQAMKGDREKCLAAGANDYLSKPIDVDRLLALLKNY